MRALPVPVARLREVLTGKARPFTRAGSRSGIHKSAVEGPCLATRFGLHGDEQGDPRVHGGPDKAVHVYPWSHYAVWRELLEHDATAQRLLAVPGAFGENFSLDGDAPLTEHEVCIGDRWSIGGDAQFELSQGRQPCWKLNDRFGQSDMAARMQSRLITG